MIPYIVTAIFCAFILFAHYLAFLIDTYVMEGVGTSLLVSAFVLRVFAESKEILEKENNT